MMPRCLSRASAAPPRFLHSVASCLHSAVTASATRRCDHLDGVPDPSQDILPMRTHAKASATKKRSAANFLPLRKTTAFTALFSPSEAARATSNPEGEKRNMAVGLSRGSIELAG